MNFFLVFFLFSLFLFGTSNGGKAINHCNDCALFEGWIFVIFLRNDAGISSL